MAKMFHRQIQAQFVQLRRAYQVTFASVFLVTEVLEMMQSLTFRQMLNTVISLHNVPRID